MHQIESFTLRVNYKLEQFSRTIDLGKAQEQNWSSVEAIQSKSKYGKICPQGPKLAHIYTGTRH